MKKDAFIKTLNSIAPFELQYDWDNSGVQINLGHESVSKVLVAMEISNDVITEAIDNKADMIITHHPILFNPIKKIDCSDIIQNYIIRLISFDIEVISLHTNFDVAKGGNNDYFMKLCGVEKARELFDQCGRIGQLKEAVTFESFICKLDDSLNHPGIKFNGDLDRKIKTVACCTGAGGDYLAPAIEAGADVFISGDIKHNPAQIAKESGICLVDAGHWGTEQIFTDNFAAQLRQKAKSITILKSTVNLNPFSSII